MNNKSDSFEHSEVISAYLDGEVTEEERAFVEESPDLLKEVEKLKKIQKITSSPTPIDPVLQEKHLAKALSSLPKGGKVIPFRQQKIIQRGTLLAVAAAAAAFILIPVINSQNNESSSESDLATGFIEDSTSVGTSAQSAVTQELEEASVVPESAQEAGTTTEPSRNSQDSQNDEPESEAATDLGARSAVAEDQAPEGEAVGEIEEEAQEENEVEAQQLATSGEIAEELSSRVFVEEAETINSLLETANNIWETNDDIFSIPLTLNQIDNFFNENTDFLTCWIEGPFFDTSIRTPLFLQQLIINGSPSVVLISEDLQSELNPVLSVYQVDSSCLLFFEGPISGEIPPE
tara:strand:- start:171 stop:1214 length:1044 start_codon:yes stop_codon:yes gene_type:complete